MNERLSSRVQYLGSITFVVITWACGALALAYALCYHVYHWIFAT